MCLGFLPVLIFAAVCGLRIDHVKASNLTDILESSLMGHDRRVRPNDGGVPVQVGVTMYFLSIASVSETDTSFTFSAYFRQFWNDPRMSYSAPPGLDKAVTTDGEYISSVWKPDTFFVDTKEFERENEQFFRLLHTGDILLSQLVTMTGSCQMNVQYYPMDRQICRVEIESYSRTMDDIAYKWNDGVNSVQMSQDISLPQFRVMGHRQRTIEASLSTGNYSRLSVEIFFERISGYSFLQTYVPAVILVILSWASFLNSSKNSSAHLVIVIAMTVIMAISQMSRPKVAYITAEDIFLWGCFLFVTIAFIDSAACQGLHACENQCEKKWPSLLKLGRVAYPVLFVFCNILYWSILKNLTNNPVEGLVALD